MRLVRLLVKSMVTDEVVREIRFNRTGLSLIVDETDNTISGSNIGKTTAVKIIDLCLGAKLVSSLYKEKDTGENQVVKDYLEKNKIVAILECEVDGVNHIFKRALYKGGKNEVDQEVVKNYNQYITKLNEIVFLNKDNKPSFRELITKFVRLENANESSLLKYLGNHYKGYQYQAIYAYLFGIDKNKIYNVDVISKNESIDKDIEAILRKNEVASIEEFEAKLNLVKEEVDKFKKSYSEISIVEDYNDKKKSMEKLLFKLNQLEAEVAKINLKIELMEEKITKEEEKISSVDHELLKKLYDETKLYLEKPLREFRELEEFHNGMVTKRKEMLQESLNEMKEYLESRQRKLTEMQKEYEQEYVTFNTELKERFEESYHEFAINNSKLEGYLSDDEYIHNKMTEKQENLNRRVVEENDIEKQEKIKEQLNCNFKRLTDRIIGEPYAIVFNEEEEEFPIKIIGMHGNPGTGIKKAMITCFDLALIELILQEGYSMPVFEIHDKMENIDLKELGKIIKETKEFEGQYIFPILQDRIRELGIQEEDIVLRLSKDDKFFHV